MTPNGHENDTPVEPNSIKEEEKNDRKMTEK